jgi:hypothetical protein
VSVDRRQQGNETVDRKVNKPDRLSGFVEHFPEFQSGRFELNPQALILPGRNACQHAVGNGIWILHSLSTQKDTRYGLAAMKIVAPGSLVVSWRVGMCPVAGGHPRSSMLRDTGSPHSRPTKMRRRLPPSVRYRTLGVRLAYTVRVGTLWSATTRTFMPAFRDPAQNQLLAGLSAAERERVFPHLRLVPLPLGKVLYESGDVLPAADNPGGNPPVTDTPMRGTRRVMLSG